MAQGAGSRPMKLLKHRCNSQQEIDSALYNGFDGVEIDLVWNDGSLVLSHEHGGVGEDFFTVDFHGYTVAINVKEYGMCNILCNVQNDTIGEQFLFDVPGPELHDYVSQGGRVFFRFSEYEYPTKVPAGCGVLVDSFENSSKFVEQCLDEHVGLETATIGASLRGAAERTPPTPPTYLICKEKPCNLSSSTSTVS